MDHGRGLWTLSPLLVFFMLHVAVLRGTCLSGIGNADFLLSPECACVVAFEEDGIRHAVAKGLGDNAEAIVREG